MECCQQFFSCIDNCLIKAKSGIFCYSALNPTKPMRLMPSIDANFGALEIFPGDDIESIGFLTAAATTACPMKLNNWIGLIPI
jgi:hypothetical protein